MWPKCSGVRILLAILVYFHINQQLSIRLLCALTGVFGPKLSGWWVCHLFPRPVCRVQLYIINTGYYSCQDEAACLVERKCLLKWKKMSNCADVVQLNVLAHTSTRSHSVCSLLTNNTPLSRTDRRFDLSNTGVTHYIHNGFIPFWCAGLLAHLPVNGTEPSLILVTPGFSFSCCKCLKYVGWICWGLLSNVCSFSPTRCFSHCRENVHHDHNYKWHLSTESVSPPIGFNQKCEVMFQL